MEKLPRFESDPNDDNPDYGSREATSSYKENLKRQRQELNNDDKQNRVNEHAREVLERLNKLGANPKEKKRPDKFKNRSEQ